MLNVTLLRVGREPHTTAPALNDAVVTHGAVSRLVDIMLYCDGRPVTRYRADGLIAATPTGSTAYSMSAGGPIIDPSLDCICVTPTAPTPLCAPLVLSGSELVVEDICPTTGPVSHGTQRNLTLARGDRVRIQKIDCPQNYQTDSKSGSWVFTAFCRRNNRRTEPRLAPVLRAYKTAAPVPYIEIGPDLLASITS